MMENGDEKRDDPAPTDAQLEQASTNGRSRDQDESLVIEREFYAEEDERRHADNPRLTSPQPGYKKYVISQYQFRRLNGWDADETEIDKEFEHFKEDVFLRWLGCFEEFPELSFKEICLNMHTRLSKKNFKGHLSDNQIDFFRLNRLRKTKKQSSAKTDVGVVQAELKKWIRFAENEEIRVSIQRSRAEQERSRGSPSASPTGEDENDEEAEVPRKLSHNSSSTAHAAYVAEYDVL